MTTTRTPDLPRSVPRRQRGGHRLTAIAAALLVMIGIATPAHAETTPTPTPIPTPEVTTPTDRVEVSILAGAAGAVIEGTAVPLTVTVSNPTASDQLPGRTAALLGSKLSTEGDVEAWLAGSLRVATTEIASGDVPMVTATESATISLTAPVTDPTIQGLTVGTYPLEMTYTVASVTLRVRSLLNVVPLGSTRDVTVIMPLTAAPANGLLLDATELAALTAPTGELTERLQATTADTVLAVDPAVVAAIRALGAAAPTAAVEWLDDLMSAPNPRFALQFADADLSVQARAGLTEPLPALSLEAMLSAADFPAEPATPGADPTATPAPTTAPADGATAPLPDTATLTQIGTPVIDVSWPSAGSVSEAVLALVDESITLVSASQLSGGVTGPALIGERTVMGYDATLSDAVSAVIGASMTDLPTMQARLVATTLFTPEDRPLVVVFDRTPAQTAGVTAAAASLRAAGLRGSAWSTSDPVETSLTADEQTQSTADQAAALRDLLAAESGIAVIASTLQQPEILIGRERARVLNLISAGGLQDADWLDRLGTVRAAEQSVLNAVQIVPRENVMIVSKGVNIPVWVRNDLPWPATVVLQATPNDLRLTVQPRTDVEATAQSRTSALVPVTSGVSNGDVTLRLQLLTPSGERIGPTENTVVTVRGDWETIGLVGTGVLVAFLLIFGTIRTVRRRRRAAATTDGEASDG